MNIILNNKTYEVIIEKKRIKNTYIRVKEDLKVHVTTNIFSSTSYIEKLIKDNIKSIEKMIEDEREAKIVKKNRKKIKF